MFRLFILLVTCTVNLPSLVLARYPNVVILFTDDQSRLMAIFCHNTDLGDGWEREDENEYYYKEFPHKKAYPMGINIVVYALKH